MDFHSLSRRDLQTLCKKNRVPANMTNVAMADALQALQSVEGIEEITEASHFQSPVKAEMKSPNLPRTSRRTSARRAPNPDEPKERHGSPLPRARRVAIKASEIMKLVSEGEEEKKQGTEDDASKIPEVCTGENPEAASSTRRRTSEQEDGPKEIPKTPAAARNTRRKASKETEGEDDPLEVTIISANRYSRRASTRRGAQAPMAEQDKQEDTVGLRTTRRTRQSTTKQTEEIAMNVAANVGRRTTRTKATVKMADLTQEEEEDQDKKDITTKDSIDLKNDPLQISDAKTDVILMEDEMKPEVQNGDISQSRDSGVKKDGNDGVHDLSMDRADNETTQETEKSTPVRRLVSSEHTLETNQDQEQLDGTPEEIPMVTDGASEEERGGGEDLDFALPDPSLSDEIPANVEDSGRQLLEIQAAGGSLLIEENLTVELHSELKATSDQIPDDPIQNKEEKEVAAAAAAVSLDLLPTGNSLKETKVSVNELSIVQAPEIETSTDLQANMENGDGPVEFPYEIPAAETDDSGDGVEILEDARESNDRMLIGNQTAPEPESVLKPAASSALQQYPSPDATSFPAKTSAQVSDLIGCPANSGIEADIETSSQVGDLIGESPARIVAELKDPVGDLTDSDLGDGAPVAPDHGGHETNSKEETVPEIEGGEKKRAAEQRVPADIYTTESGGGDDNKENSLDQNAVSGLTVLEVGTREAEVPDYKSLSLRKLKALLREKATNLNNEKMAGKRAVLTKLNHNRI